MRAALPAVAAALLLLTGCGTHEAAVAEPATPSTAAPATTGAEPPRCTGVPGGGIVSLEDDLGVTPAQNVIPAVHAYAAEPALLATLDAVSAALDTRALTDLNRAVNIDGLPAPDAAASFVETVPGLADAPGSGPVVVGAGGTSESVTLAHVYAGALAEAGYDVEVRVVGQREIYQPALVTGEITVAPEYVGAFADFLRTAVRGRDVGPVAGPDLEQAVTALTALGEQTGLVFGQPSPATRDMAFAVTTAFAEQHRVRTLSDLADACAGGLSLGGPPRLLEDGSGYPALDEAYGLVVSRFTALDDGGPLTKSAVTGGQVAVGVVYSSDAALAPPDETAG